MRRIAALPQAFVTTTTLDDLDQGLRAIAHHWEVRAEPDGAGLVGGAGVAMNDRRRPMVRIGDLMPATARALGLEDELRLSRAIATFEAIVAERSPRPPALAG